MRNAALVCFLILIPCSLRAQNKRDDWKALYDLRSGEKIELIETGMKKHVGTFSTITEEAIQLRKGSNEIGIRKESVARGTLLEKSHRLRNALILGVVGAGAGAGIGAAASRCSNSNTSFSSCGIGLAPRSPSARWWGWREAPVSALRYPVIPQFIEQSQQNQIQPIDAVSSRPSRAKGRVTRPDPEGGRVSGSNQNLWASRAGEKSPALFVVFENTDKTRTIRFRQRKRASGGDPEALAA